MKPRSFSTLAPIFVLIAIVALLSSTSGAVAQQPAPFEGMISYSGRLSDDADQPVADGMYAFSFALYDAPGGGNLLWSETQTGVPVQGGAFSVQLGSVTPFPKERRISQGWLAVSVRGPGEAGYIVLAPRQLSNVAPPSAPSSPAAGAACPHDHWGETWSGTGGGLDLVSNNGNALRGLSTTAGYGVFGVALSLTGGAGVVASHDYITGTALEIQQGAFRVFGAGVDTHTTVFIHQVRTGAGGNICPAYSGSATVIDHPLTNGDPNAILIVTLNGGILGHGAGPANPYIFVEYDRDNDCGFGARWVILNNLTALPDGTKFNVMVIKP